MRTTLKRGVARPESNGNGARPPRAGAPFGSPSGPLGPISRYTAWRRSGARLAGRILLWVVVSLLVAAGALGGGIWLYLNQSVVAIRASDPGVKQTEQFLDAPLPGQPTTALVIGYDKRHGEAGDPGRSDTLMLLRASPDDEALTMLSFPRDLVVDHPGCKDHLPWRDRINTAYAFCGPSGAVRTVKQLTGVPVNYVIVVNFRAFKQIVNKVDGVYVDVDRRYFNDNSGYEEAYATINLQPGYQKLTGGAALDYARFRHTDSDLHRIARQQAFVKAFKQQVQASISVLKLPGIINTIVENVEVGRGGQKQLDFDTVFGYARFIYGLPSGHFFQARINGLTGSATLEASGDSVQAAVRSFLNPDLEADEKATQSASGQKVRGSAPRPGDVSILVLNGNGVDGSASEATSELASRGYPAESGGNADNFRYFESKVVYDPARAGAQAAAKQVADLFGDATVAAAPAAAEMDTMLEVIVGRTFTGTLAPTPADDTPDHAPPSVEPVSSELVPLLRAAKRKVDFTVMVPTVGAAGTILDPEVPVRAYSVNRRDAIKLVFRRSYGSYWGVMQTAWTDAPILSGANVTRKIGGREYRLYYDGAKLHMVAFEQDGAVYWVSNTLLDELSNETMLAIAKGLRPLASVQ